MVWKSDYLPFYERLKRSVRRQRRKRSDWLMKLSNELGKRKELNMKDLPTPREGNWAWMLLPLPWPQIRHLVNSRRHRVKRQSLRKKRKLKSAAVFQEHSRLKIRKC